MRLGSRLLNFVDCHPSCRAQCALRFIGVLLAVYCGYLKPSGPFLWRRCCKGGDDGNDDWLPDFWIGFKQRMIALSIFICWYLLWQTLFFSRSRGAQYTATDWWRWALSRQRLVVLHKCVIKWSWSKHSEPGPRQRQCTNLVPRHCGSTDELLKSPSNRLLGPCRIEI